MQSPLSRYVFLVKRWSWLIVLGVALCGGITFLSEKFTPSIYQASAELVIITGSSASSDVLPSIAAVPTYAQLLTSPVVLEPVVAKHRGMTLEQLNAILAVKPQPNTLLIELDIQNHDPSLAMQLANEICQSFALYSNSRLPATIQILPALEPTAPIKPKPLQDAGIAALVGLSLAITLILIFEWIDDRPISPEQVQELLGMEILASLPRAVGDPQGNGLAETPALVERYGMLCASLHAVQENWPFKLIMVTSALAGEGKTTVAASIAIFLAKSGKRVLLVDANLRHPSLNQRFQLDNPPGLTNVLLEARAQPLVELYCQGTAVPTLRVLPAGNIPENPTALLHSPLAHKLFGYFRTIPLDYIILDAPPLLSVADAQLMIPLVEAVVLVIDASKTPRSALLRTRSVLNRTRTKVIGVALNKSHWPDYGNGDMYRGNIHRSQIEDVITRPQQHAPIASPVPAGTPPQRLVPWLHETASWEAPPGLASQRHARMLSRQQARNNM